MTEKPTQEDVVSVSIDTGDGGVVVQTTTKHRELSLEALRELEHTLIVKGKEISRALEHWYPCGFAWLNVHGNSRFVRFVKEHGEEGNNKSWSLDRIRILKNDYDGGYDVRFEYPAGNPTEQQSLNFKRPLYSLFQDLLALLSVETTMHTRVD